MWYPKWWATYRSEKCFRSSKWLGIGFWDLRGKDLTHSLSESSCDIWAGQEMATLTLGAKALSFADLSQCSTWAHFRWRWSRRRSLTRFQNSWERGEPQCANLRKLVSRLKSRKMWIVLSWTRPNSQKCIVMGYRSCSGQSLNFKRMSDMFKVSTSLWGICWWWWSIGIHYRRKRQL